MPPLFPPSTDRVTFTPTVTGTNNPANVAFISGSYVRGVGEESSYMFIDFNLQTVTGALGGATALALTIPGGFSIDTTKLWQTTATSNVAAHYLGGDVQANIAGWRNLWPVYASSTTIQFNDAGQKFTDSQLTAGTSMQCRRIKVPIVGW